MSNVFADTSDSDAVRPNPPTPAPRPQDPFATIEELRTAIAERDAAREANATTPAPTAAPEPPPAPASDPIEIMRAELGHKGYWVQVRAEMLERAYRVTGGDASRAVDLLLLILR